MYENKSFTDVAAIAIAGAVFIGVQVDAHAEVAPCNPSTVAYWRFDGGYTDSCGSIHGTMVGSASIATSNCAPVPGSSGCLVLNGSPSRVDLPAPFNPTHTSTLSAGTVEAWVFFEGTNEGDGSGAIFNHGIPALFTDMFIAVRPHAGGGYDSEFQQTGGVIARSFLPGFTLNTWHHLAWTWDATAVTYYMDGVVVGTAAGPVSVSFTGNEAEIGSDDQETFYWVGRLDEIRLSNRVLLPCEFLFQSPQCPTLSEWGMMATAGLMVLAGVVVLSKRHRAA